MGYFLKGNCRRVVTKLEIPGEESPFPCVFGWFFWASGLCSDRVKRTERYFYLPNRTHDFSIAPLSISSYLSSLSYTLMRTIINIPRLRNVYFAGFSVRVSSLSFFVVDISVMTLQRMKKRKENIQ